MINVKRGLFVFCLFGIILLGLANASAISSDIKSSYQPQETMIIKIGGNILSFITASNVEFRRGHVAVPLEYDIKKINGTYYLWAIAPVNVNNYTLVVKSISTTVSGKSALVDYESNFSVAGNTTDYYVRPGFVYASDNFDINVWLNEDEDKSVEAKFIDSEDVVLKPGSNKISFSIEDVEETGKYELVLGKYTLPVYIVKDSSEAPVEVALPDLRFKPRFIESTVLKGKNADYPIYLINAGGSDVKKVDLIYNKNLFSLSPESFNLSSGEKKEIILSLKNPADDDIDEIIFANGEGFSINMSVKIETTGDESKAGTPYLKDDYSESEQYYCNELNGMICTADEICSNTTAPALDGTCCLGKCSAPKSWTKIWIGLAIIAVVALIGYFVWMKYRKIKPNQDVIAQRIK